ncbi:unnamed protein product [Auanema sp. JU1783]|nr:unnamed protein product [Auanema sp. JU1783]
MVGRAIKKAGVALTDSIRRTFSTKKWEHKEQLHSLVETDKFFLKKVRWQISLMAHVGFALAFAIRSNFGVAKNRMISNFTDAYGTVHEQQFFWSPTELGMMESSFFYGYAASQIPAGMLAAKFAPNKLFCLGILIAGLTNVIVAIGLQYHPFTDFVVMGLQIVQGLALGVTYPAMHGVWRYWAPPLERSKLVTTTFTGSYIGVMLGLPVSASLVSYIHWSAPFYVFGAMAIVWSVGWWFVSACNPHEHMYISDEEKRFITEKVGAVVTSDMTLTTVPWKTILLSPPVWAIVICNFCRSWTFFLLLGNQLTYMKDVLHIDIRDSGLISMLPQLLMAITVLSSGQLSDYLRATGKMETGNVRKLFNSMGFGGEACFLCILAFLHDPAPAITCLVLSTAFSGFAIAGFNVNHFDIAPRYASILMGFSNGLGALAGMGGIITQNLTADNPGGWKYCFLLAVGVDLFGLIFYLIFAKGDVQEWAREAEPEETMGEFVRRISTMVRSSLTRPRFNSQKSRDYDKMDESRHNSSEMKATYNVTDLQSIQETEDSPRQSQTDISSTPDSLKPDRPSV